VTPGKDGEAVDRCALFVDAGYVLADGAMAVHGTRRGESVSWDYEGLLQLLSSLARERTGLPLLRCYWYEATVDGGRTAEQEALADVPGIKLRVAKIRPGRREGVETEIHRDLTTLARNNAISDALVLSAEEDLAQAIADVQDLGLRVTLVHVAMDGNWTIARALRQESDDIIEIGAEQLRPYVELIAGAEPAHAEEPEGAEPAVARPLANGHAAGAGSYQQVPAGAAGPAVSAMYAAPVAAEYQRAALQLPRVAAREDRPREDPPREDRPRDDRPRDDRPREDRPRDDRPREDRPRDDRAREDRTPQPAINGDAQASSWQDVYAAPPTVARPRLDRPEPVPPPDAVSGLAGVPGQEPAQAAPGQLRRLPTRSTGQQPGGPAGSMGGSLGSMGSEPGGLHGGQRQGLQGVHGPARGSHFSGPQPVATSPAPGYQSPGSGVGVSLAEAVQAAHEEGQEFGGSVARDAPALWLEAVLARKPRMPSDLEARLLQGSALPIDYLLHDEVRHALRRGFWDALERTRR
jgi:uncharacterized LabA/DUF88 family protein